MIICIRSRNKILLEEGVSLIIQFFYFFHIVLYFSPFLTKMIRLLQKRLIKAGNVEKKKQLEKYLKGVGILFSADSRYFLVMVYQCHRIEKSLNSSTGRNWSIWSFYTLETQKLETVPDSGSWFWAIKDQWTWWKMSRNWMLSESKSLWARGSSSVRKLPKWIFFLV